MKSLSYIAPAWVATVMENNIIEKVTVLNSSSYVTNFMREIIKTKEDDESFYILDLNAVVQQYNCWKNNLPAIKPYYAVKCNDTKPLMEVLLALGTGFDCASQDEMKKALELGATPNDIIFANPSKLVRHIQYAKEHGISLMTFDSVCELEKLKKHYPEGRLVLRIRVEAESCLIPLGNKFGCKPEEADGLLKSCKNMGLTVIGISFHVGTGCKEAEAYPRAIHTAAALIKKAQKNGISIKYLDIGGGFPGDSDEMFEKIAYLIKEALETEKTTLQNIKLIAEPGRFFACNAFTLATTITSVKKCELCDIYYINNGIYGSFNSVYTENAIMCPVSLDRKSETKIKCLIWGQTEEKNDKIINECWLPEMKTGDWLYFENIGAYSTVLSVGFHGFALPHIYPVIGEKEWRATLQYKGYSIKASSHIMKY